MLSLCVCVTRGQRFEAKPGRRSSGVSAHFPWRKAQLSESKEADPRGRGRYWVWLWDSRGIVSQKVSFDVNWASCWCFVVCGAFVAVVVDAFVAMVAVWISIKPPVFDMCVTPTAWLHVLAAAPAVREARPRCQSTRRPYQRCRGRGQR